MNHYETLGVARDASQDDIKRAYRKLASQHHPDRGGDTKRFQEIQAAYDVIGDPERRQQYNAELDGHGAVKFQFHDFGPGGTPPDIGEIFRSFGFGFDPFAQHRQHQRRNKDLRIEIALPLVSTLEEQYKTVSVQTTNGHRETVQVQIPRGVTTGTQIKYSGLGDNLFNTLPRGDLYVVFTVHGDHRFSVLGIDLSTKIKLNCLLAVVGANRIIEGPDGRQFEITIPPGTQPGTRFRIPRQGLYVLNSEQRGDLYAEIEIYVPTISDFDQLESLKNIASTE